MNKHLVTSALPYANGPLHFGHLAGAYLPADIYTRHKRRRLERVIHISGSDEHGVAIMLNAQKANCSYKEYVDKWHKNHFELFKKYGIDFDFFGQTSAEYHKNEVLEWFKILYEKKMIVPKDNNQLFCNDCENHLPDRFVEGECYKCGFEAARGDECPSCGEWIDPTKLIKPVCKMCGSTNIKEVVVTQYYLMLSKFHKKFRSWFETKKDWRKTVVPFVDSLSKEQLIDRAITRDLDWGIDVPLEGCEGKKLYVWFDAPIGYVSNTKKYLESAGLDEHYLDDWWNNRDTKITHFIGKDNIIFHAIIFPVMSMASERICPPDDVPANQYLNLEGKQFSKSTGWYIDSEDAIEKFGQDALRYYLTTLIPETNDSSFSWDQFVARVNNELANNIGNFVNRCLKFSTKNWPEGIDQSYLQSFKGSDLESSLKEDLLELQDLLEKKQIKKGLEKIMFIGQNANTYFSDNAPWAQIKQDKDLAAQTIAISSIYVFTIGVILGPYLPMLSQKILDYFDVQVDDSQIADLYKGQTDALGTIFSNGLKVKGRPEALIPKIEPSQIEKLKEQLMS